MNIESKARAGFTSIMLRGGRMTKWKGQVASYAPQVGHLQSVSVAAMAAALAFGGAMAVPSEAMAQDVNVVIDTPPPFDSVKHVNNGTGALNIEASVGIVGDNAAVEATNGPDATDLNIDITAAIGANNGILANNGGKGATSITATQAVTGLAGVGIDAQNGPNTTDLTIDVANVTGANIGIRAINGGTGVTTVTSTGLVTGAFNGVYVDARENTQGVSVSVKDVSATGTANFSDAINVQNGGAGSTVINASGAVSSTAGAGIAATNLNGSSATDLLIVANSVTGDDFGIVVSNRGAGGGKTSITATGDVTATDGGSIGIDALNANPNTTDLTIDVANVTGANIGIRAINGGTGVTTVTSTGLVTGAFNGVYVDARENTQGVSVSVKDVSAGENAINILNGGSGLTNIAVNGLIAGGDHGINLSNGDTDANLDATVTLAVGGNVTGANSAINLENGGTGNAKLTLNGDITAATTAISAVSLGSGTASVTVNGDISGVTGVSFINGLNTADVNGVVTVVDGGSVTGTVNGISAINNNGASAINLVSTGKVSGGTTGIFAINSAVGTDVIVSGGDVTGGVNGIDANNVGTGNTIVSGTGTVVGTTGNGIDVYNGATAKNMTVNANNVTGALNGIEVDNQGAGGITNITVSGVVAGGAGYATGLYNGILAYNGENTGGTAASGDTAGTGLTITSTKVSEVVGGVAVPTITGGNSGIYAQNYGAGSTTLVIAGAVEGVNGDGIFVYNGEKTLGAALNVASVTGGDDGIFVDNQGVGNTLLESTGTVVGKTGNGVEVFNGATAKNVTINANNVTGAINGINAVNEGNGVIDVTVTGLVQGGLHGVNLTKGAATGDLTGSVNVTGTGEVKGAVNGVNFVNDAGGSATLVSSGKVSGDLNGIFASNGLGTVNLSVSSGDVTGGFNGISARNLGTGTTTVTGTGTITGGANGLVAFNTDVGSDVTINVNNITGTAANGILVGNDGTGVTRVTSTGTVTGGVTGINAYNDVSSLGGLFIDANNATGGVGGVGILAFNNGGGVTDVIARGDVVGGQVGIAAFNSVYGTGTDVSVTAKNAKGTTYQGIFAANYGTGSTKVVSTGLVESLASDGISAYNDSSAINLEVTAVDVKAAADGIDAENRGSGFTTITVSGTITANNDGIEAYNYDTAKGLTIVAKNITVGDPAVAGAVGNGIFAINYGAGDTIISSDGVITAKAGDGIFAANGRSAQDLTITVADVSGSVNGVTAFNYSAEVGSTTVSSSGTVSGGTYGILARNGTEQTDLTVNVKNVSGGYQGINTINFGTGDTTITSDGLVNGGTDDGINALNLLDANDLTIDVAAVTGKTTGILATNIGSGNTVVIAKGNVTGETAFGIAVVGGGNSANLKIEAVNVTGALDGIGAINNGSGYTNVKSTGTVTGGNNGIFAANTDAGNGVTVDVANVTGLDGYGLLVTNYGAGITTILASGDVTGGAGDGIYALNDELAGALNISVKNVTGSNSGISAVNNGAGATSVTSTGTVTGTDTDGISVVNDAEGTDILVDANIVKGDEFGIVVTNNGTGSAATPASTTIKAKGDVTGTNQAGIFALNGTNTDNLLIDVANVTGGLDGIFARNTGNGDTSVKSSGTTTTVKGALNGIVISNTTNGGAVSVDANNVTGTAGFGIIAVNNGDGATSIVAKGDVTGGAGDGIYANNAATAGALTVSANNVTGSGFGISVIHNGAGAASVKADGTVTGQGVDGISIVNTALGTDILVDANVVKGEQFGIVVTNNGTGSAGTPASTTIKARGDVTGTTQTGILASNAANTDNLTIDVVNVTGGGGNGISASNSGNGDTSVTSKGTVIGASNGIAVFNTTAGGALLVDAVTVTGSNGIGVVAVNNGDGATSVRASGDVTGTTYGIYASNAATAGALTVSANNVTGGVDGIFARNNGTGDTSVTSKGTVTGALNGIVVSNTAIGGAVSVDATNATGTGGFGIIAVNNGNGATSVLAKGNVTGGAGDGINAFNAATAGSLTIDASSGTGTVTGSLSGIDAVNNGSGVTSVTAKGTVTGTTADGISVVNDAEGTAILVDANVVRGDDFGIFVTNNGVGSAAAPASTTIKAKGDVTGTTLAGIFANNTAGTTNLTIEAANVTGAIDGIIATNNGNGASSVTSIGSVNGATANGIAVLNGASATTLSVAAKDAKGAINGILADNKGTGASTLSVTGKIIGGTGAGIATFGNAGKLTTISLAATAEVSAASGAAISNNESDSVLNVAKGTLINGTIRLGNGSDTANFLIDNTAAFATITALDGGDNISAADGFVDTLNLNGAGTYDLVGARVTNWEAVNINAGRVRFSDAAITAGAITTSNGGTLDSSNNLAITANMVVAKGGTLLVGNAAGNANVSIIGNLSNAGLVNLSGAAGKAGDRLNVSGNFTNAGGQTTIDTVIGADNSPTDLLIIGGNVSGTGLVAINNVGGVGGLTVGDGIKLVQVGGTSSADALQLAGGDLQVGGFRYDLFLGGIADPNDQDWYLRTVGLSDIAATTLSLARLSDDISMTFLGTLQERVGEQEHIAKRDYQSGGVSGLWGRFIGKGFRDRLASKELGEVKSNGSITGMQMGLDFVRKISGNGSAAFAGVYAGYADGSSSDTNIFQDVARRSGGSKSKGWLTGLYGTYYGSTGWYANAVVQASFLDAAANAANGTKLKTEGRTFLGSLEMGKSLKLGGRLAFEPQLQVIYGNNKFDGAIDSDEILNKVAIEDSIIGRVGFRLKTTKDEKYSTEGGLFSGYLKTNLWHNLLGADVSSTIAGQSIGKLEPKKTWVDIGFGTTLTVAKQTEIFVDADVEFGIDQKTTAGTGKVGLRFNW
ncbi:autotransporter outer membrane beta-barrel domain-containing protein [Sphingorhabdus sp. IMCC26285]|uniref:Autotransporter outer membrane beta-barrel domain-containing protein n=1 Tax=Sphingorhabdus profundilacus TaxID=2509718 RepID=A0A6I4LXS7_9SPHN|nr:autotransporter outer membrane beta-barrel domain-containing protein [Sphingorhabdus profundilacus]MVZ97689.1 autotransporter outer membrane beta-barrel domain-containing protein [Sphingorhabdus profundilacus]